MITQIGKLLELKELLAEALHLLEESCQAGAASEIAQALEHVNWLIASMH
ncbi:MULTISPECIES: hypothetical protein [unclassified Sphingomonas]|nr:MULTISPECIES: hypothetical protein [unclassified Sphingomonas]